MGKRQLGWRRHSQDDRRDPLLGADGDRTGGLAKLNQLDVRERDAAGASERVGKLDVFV